MKLHQDIRLGREEIKELKCLKLLGERHMEKRLGACRRRLCNMSFTIFTFPRKYSTYYEDC